MPGGPGRRPLAHALRTVVVDTSPRVPVVGVNVENGRVSGRRWYALLVVVVLGVVAGCSPSTGAGGSEGDNQRYISGTGEVETVPAAERKAAPALSGTSLDGKQLSTQKYRGKVLVVNFWASWCAPCRSEAPALQGVYDETEKDGVRFVGVNFKDNRTNARVFVDEFELTYPSIYDQPGETALAFRGELPPAAVPSTIVVDRDGKVAARIIGETTYTRLLRVVREVARA